MSSWLFLIPVLLIIITAAVLAKGGIASRVAMVSAGFGLSAALIIALCFYLWAIGVISYQSVAVWGAVILNIGNLVAAINVIGRIRETSPEPSQE